MIEVKETEGKWGLFIDNVLIGTSKTRSEADFAKSIIIKHIKTRFNISLDD